jgi:hypothetical protein
MEEYRQTNQLELHVNNEIQAELQRETTRQTMHSHLYAVYRVCSSECIGRSEALSAKERNCLNSCYTRLNEAQYVYMKALLM